MIVSYIKIAWKVLLRRKFFTFISLFGISFTLLVLMVVTAILDHTFAPMVPESRQPRMLGIYTALMWGKNSTTSSEPGYKLLDRYARGLDEVERLTIFTSSGPAESYLDGRKITSTLTRTDAEYWQVLDFTFLEGAPYTAQDVERAAFVAVINETTRQRFFGGRPAVGQTIEADGQRFRVVGVVPDVSSLRISSSDLWVPITTAKSDAYKRELLGGCLALVLAKEAAALPRIREQFYARVARAELDDPKMYQAIIAPLETRFEHNARQIAGNRQDPQPQGGRLVALLVGFGLLFLLLPTVNLININVSRIMERASEIGVRKAFGASARTLVGQFLVENIILTLVGGAIGLVLSFFVLRALTASGFIPYAVFHINLRVFLSALALAALFGVLSGVYPAWRMSRMHPVQALKGASR